MSVCCAELSHKETLLSGWLNSDAIVTPSICVSGSVLHPDGIVYDRQISNEYFGDNSPEK